MKSSQKSRIPLLLALIGPLVLASCGVDIKRSAEQGCPQVFADNRFSHDQTSITDKQLACIQGVQIGTDAGIGASSQPTLAEYRAIYRKAKDRCLTEIVADSGRAACLDGLDFLAAVGAQQADYAAGQYQFTQMTLPASYFRGHGYDDVYDDATWTDEFWVYILVNRRARPELYPGYRRDEMYYSPSSLNAHGLQSFYLANNRAVDWSASDAFTASFGPGAEARPYREGTRYYTPPVSQPNPPFASSPADYPTSSHPSYPSYPSSSSSPNSRRQRRSNPSSSADPYRDQNRNPYGTPSGDRRNSPDMRRQPPARADIVVRPSTGPTQVTPQTKRPDTTVVVPRRPDAPPKSAPMPNKPIVVAPPTSVSRPDTTPKAPVRPNTAPQVPVRPGVKTPSI